MDPRDASQRPAEATAELGPGDDAADEGGSVVDLSAPPDSDEAGSLAALLGGVAAAPSTEPPFELQPGAELGSIYRIVRRLGAGGMGVVYLARDLELQRDVAVKVHRSAVGVERLYREAVAMAQLAHPNVVTIHGVGRINGRLYIALEYVQGDNLAVWRKARPRSWRDVVDVMLAAGEGLAAAHDAGFVHRDVKPHNILVGLDDRPRVGDFGLVRVTGDSGRADSGGDDERPPPTSPSSEPTRPLPRAAVELADTMAPSPSPTARTPSVSPLTNDLTAIGSAMGTPAYMAPEQLAGHAVDARADLFSFCVVLYEALYGQRPWPGSTFAELRAQVATTPPREPAREAVPAWIWPVLQRGLRPKPDDRYPDVRALLAALRSPPRGRLVTAAMIGGGLAAVAAVAVVATRTGPGEPPCDAAGSPALAIWGPSTRSSIAANYVHLDPGRGPEAANALAVGVDAWSMRWQRAAVTSCLAARARRWSPAIAAASGECLRSSLDQLRTLVARAEKGPEVISDTAALPDVDACADPGQLVGGTPASPAAIEGHWNGAFGHLVLRRVGDEIWGVYEHDEGTVRGAMAGTTFLGWWCEAPSRRAPGDAGDVEMKVIVDRDGVHAIAGRWRYGAEGEWDDRWDLTLDPAPAPPGLVGRLDVVADFCAPPPPP